MMPSYPTSINRIPELRSNSNMAAFPNAELLATEIVTLPIHEYMTDPDFKRIEAALCDVSKGA